MILKRTGMVSILLLAIFTLTIMVGLVSAQEWAPFVPNPGSVELSYWSKGRKAYVKVTITLGTPCYEFDWGIVSRDDSQLWADSEIWQYQGICIQVVTTFAHIYELGKLKFRETYTFTFKAWGYPIESITFKHLPPGHLR